MSNVYVCICMCIYIYIYIYIYTCVGAAVVGSDCLLDQANILSHNIVYYISVYYSIA